MAIDTQRKRLDALARRSGDRKLWGPTWNEAGRPRRPARRPTAFARSIGIGSILLLGAAAIFWFREPLGLAPVIGVASDRIYGARLPGCDSLASRYDRAITGLGGPFDENSRTGFARAQEGCVREASAMASSSRAAACQSAVQYFGRALERRRSLAAIPVSGKSGTIGGSASGITTGEDGSGEESLARSLIAECRG